MNRTPFTQTGQTMPAPMMEPTCQGTLSKLASWPARFRSKIRHPSDSHCWVWTAALGKNGYGKYCVSPGMALAHRVAYQLANPTDNIIGVSLDHLCRNRNCVNPDHLEPVTTQENTSRGRSANMSGRCRAGFHSWTEENIMSGPPSASAPYGWRRCRPCFNAARRRRHIARKG